MINEILKKAGLNAAQSKTYLALIKHGPQSAAKLAEIVDESRTNIYQILDKIVLYDLVVKIESGKTLFKAPFRSRDLSRTPPQNNSQKRKNNQR